MIRWEKKKPMIQYVRCMTNLFIFRRLKINHVSHEFILEFGTVADTYNKIKMTGNSYTRAQFSHVTDRCPRDGCPGDGCTRDDHPIDGYPSCIRRSS
jgi:hypothetical protein